MKAGGGARQNASLEQGAQLSTTTQRGTTTSRHHHTEKLSGESYQPLYLPGPRKRQGLVEGVNFCTKERFRAQKNWIQSGQTANDSSS